MIKHESDRISKQYHLYGMRSEEHYSWMFIQDVHEGILPSRRTKQENLAIKLEPSNPEFENLIVEMLGDTNSFMRDSFETTIAETIERIANHLAYQGILVYEYFTYKGLNDELHHRLVPIQFEDVRIKETKVVQILPDEAVTQFGYPKEIEIPKEKCFVIEFPKKLGGVKGYKRFLEKFRSLGKKSPYMNFFSSKLTNAQGYDINENQRIHELEMYRVSNRYGWHHRDNSRKLFSGYHYIYRYLRFKRNKIILRDYLVESLQFIIAKLGKDAGLNVSLHVDGLVTLDVIDKAISDWASGELTAENSTHLW